MNTVKTDTDFARRCDGQPGKDCPNSPPCGLDCHFNNAEISSGPPLPGQLWPAQGGRYAGIMRSDDGLTGWHLIVPEGDEFQFSEAEWDPADKGTNCHSRFDGYTNTLAMAAGRSELAKKIRALPGDCYLPARAETALMFATMPEDCGIGWYWTSSHDPCSNPWIQHSIYGSQIHNPSSIKACARAVRRLLLQPIKSSVGAA